MLESIVHMVIDTNHSLISERMYVHKRNNSSNAKTSHKKRNNFVQKTN